MTEAVIAMPRQYADGDGAQPVDPSITDRRPTVR